MAEVLNTGGDLNTAAPQGHDAAMAAAVDQKNAELANLGNDAPKPQEPLLGKFQSVDDLAKAYQELERKLGQKPQEPAKPEVGDLTPEKLDELAEKNGFDIEDMSSYYEANGGLSDDHYAQLEKAGIPRAYVDQYIAGVEAEAERAREEIYQEVGGEQAFQAMAQWALANLSKEDLNRYNLAVESGDMDTVRSAVMSLAYRYQKAAGSDPKLVNGQNGGGAGGFESLAQLTAAMQDPRYERDPAYRREVEAKLARSNIF